MNKLSILFLIIVVGIFSGCSTRGKKAYIKHKPPTNYSENKNSHSSKMDKKSYSHPTMNPYTIRGIKYYPSIAHVGDKFKGNASWYGPKFQGKKTSNGEIYNMHDMTAAHKTLPMNTIVKVTSLVNGLTTVVRINDRGPFIATRIIDLSNAAAHKIDMVGAGTAPVKIEILGFQVRGKKTISPKKQLKSVPQEAQAANFAIQIGSFSNFNGAIKTQELHNELDGYKTIIKDMNNRDGSRVFKVWLSGFKSEQEARDYKAISIFQNSFIVRDN